MQKLYGAEQYPMFLQILSKHGTDRTDHQRAPLHHLGNCWLPMCISMLGSGMNSLQFSVVQAPAAPTNLSFSEDDFMDGCSSHDGSSVVGHDYCPRRSRKLSGSRAWERASETDQADGGYDVILISDVPYAVNSLKKLYALISKCLRPPYGVLYVASKKNLVGSNGGARQLRALMEEEGVLGGHFLTELSDREIWKFFFK